MSIRINHLTTAHSADDVRVFSKECCSLAKAGYEVVLTVPHSKAESRGGIRIRPVALPSNRLSRVLTTSLRILATTITERAEVYHFHDPELIPVGMLLKVCGRRVIYDVHEDVPAQTLGKHWVPPALRPALANLLSLIERIGAHFFDGVVAATPTIAARFPRHKTVTVHNYALAEAMPMGSLPVTQRGRCMVYVGGISRDRGLFQMLDALNQMDGQLLLAGKFSPPSLAEDAMRMAAWDQVDYRGVLDQVGVAATLAEARLGLVTLQPTPSYIHSLPVKLFEYMLAGLPVVASDFPLWREIVAGARCGLLVDPQDPTAIAQACQWLLDNPEMSSEMGLRGRAAVIKKYNWSSESRNLIRFYRRFVGRGQPILGSGDPHESRCAV